MRTRRCEAALWQDVECGGYAADLERLTELVGAARGTVVELGAGTGRVALELARMGGEIVAVERDELLAAELSDRASRRGLDGRLEVLVADAADAALEARSVDLVLAPMQFVHLLPPTDRAALLDRVRDWLVPGGRFAAVVLADAPEAIAGGAGEAPPLPDVRELDGWVLSSLPIEIRTAPGRVEVERLRQAVSPSGELTETRAVDVLWDLTADRLVAEASNAGFTEAGRERLPADELHVDSILVELEAR